jgi:hypothetical protein
MQKLVIIIAIVCGVFTVHAQNKILKGKIKDNMYEMPVAGVEILDTISQKLYKSNYKGEFFIEYEKVLHLKFNHKHYQTDNPVYTIVNDTFLIIYMQQSIQLKEVVIEQKTNKIGNVSGLNAKELMSIPSITGKPDLTRALQNLPGVGMGNELTGMLLVRGGDPGQNMYLMDDIPLTYVHHFGGFFSVFNPEIIDQVDVYKGDFPTFLGGKTSSFIDVKNKEGDWGTKKTSYSVGLTDLSFSFQGPGKFKNTSYIFTGRKTLIDLLILLGSATSGSGLFSYGFHDFNYKYAWKINDKNKLWANVFYNDDYIWGRYSYNAGSGTDNFLVSNLWGNLLFSIHSKNIINDKFIIHTSLGNTRYRLNNGINADYADDSKDFKRRTKTWLNDITLRSKATYDFLPYWKMQMGVQVSKILYNPFELVQTSMPEVNAVRLNSLEASYFVGNQFTLSPKIKANVGVRNTLYQDEDKVLTYNYWEPRLNLTYDLKNQQKIIVAYNKTHQFNHYLFNNNLLFNNQIFLPANAIFKPQYAHQVSASYLGDLHSKNYSFEISAYYKSLFNLTQFKDGFLDVLGDGNWQNKVDNNGIGEAYGLETMLRKNNGKIKGFAAYTFSRSFRQYQNINFGNKYVFEFDRPHVFNVFVEYKFSNTIDFNILWTFQSGLPFTEALGKQLAPEFVLNPDGEMVIEFRERLLYGNRNGGRMRDYHRLDLSMKYHYINKKGRDATWTFGVYNAYNRQNPYANFYGNSDAAFNSGGNMVLYQISLMMITPNFSYSVKF